MKKILILLLSVILYLPSCSSDEGKGYYVEPPAPTTAIRAVWIPDPSHTDAMISYQNVLNSVKLLDELNINTVYLCAWARSQTIYKSQVLKDNSTYASKEDGYLFNNYMGNYNTPTASPTGDPVKDLITEAHKKGIKVVFWFEYGFMASNGKTPANNPILAKNPSWLGIAADGNQSNYNGTDYYFNGYDPAVQNFMLALIDESMTLYPEIDGIQGDDRMPAMPRNSGYDDYTTNKYKAEHDGVAPPTQINDSTWVRWRLNILNDFGKKMYQQIKAKKANAWVCFSPNPYPWCMDNLMQEWPKWIENNIVDVLSVQCYRSDVASYTNTIQEARKYIKQKTNKRIFNPGMILKNGSNIMSPALLEGQLNANKDINTNGEAFFYIDGLKDSAVQKVLKKWYNTKMPTE